MRLGDNGMNWKDEIKKDVPFDWDKEMKNISDNLQKMYSILGTQLYSQMTRRGQRGSHLEEKRTKKYVGEMTKKVDSINDSYMNLKNWYENVKEKLE
tara:strand:- start:534 stop:824 length:291 start_codon:yes stop_codon:yes gene_type:complete